MRDGDGDLLVCDEVFQLQLGGFVDDDGAADVAVLVADLFELGDDDAAELLLRRQDALVVGDVVADLGEFVEELVDGELGEAVELQFEDGVDLAVAEDERAGGTGGCDGRAEERLVDAVLVGVERDALEFGSAEVDAATAEVGEEVFAGVGAVAAVADDADDLVEMVERDLQAEQGVFAFAGLAEEEGGAAADDLDAVLDEGADGVGQREFARLAVVDGQEDHAEALLHGGVLVELVEHDFRLRAALEFNDDAHAVAVGLVADVGDVVNDLVGDELRDALDEVVLVDLVGDFADDDRLAAALELFRGALGAHEETTAAGAVALADVALARR